MIPEIISIVWLNVILVAFLFGFGFRLGVRLVDALIGLFARGG